MPKTYTTEEVKEMIKNVFDYYEIDDWWMFQDDFEMFLNNKGLNSNNGDNTDNQSLTEEYLDERIESFII